MASEQEQIAQIGRELSRVTEQNERLMWEANRDSERVASLMLQLETALENWREAYGVLVRLWNEARQTDIGYAIPLDTASGLYRDFDRAVLHEQ